MNISYFETERDNAPKSLNYEWPDLAVLLSTHTKRPQKSGHAWAPAEFLPGASRGNEGVRAVTLAVFDVDHAKMGDLADLRARLEGLEYVIHSTHSHRPPDDGAYRVVLPIDAPIAANAWRGARAAAAQLLGIAVDPQTCDPARLYYLPSCPIDAEPFVTAGKGRPLESAKLLELAGAAVASVPAARKSLGSGLLEAVLDTLPAELATPGEAPQVARGGPVELKVLRSALVGRRAGYASAGQDDKKRLLDRLLRGQPLADAAGERDSAINRVATLVAQAIPTDTPIEAALELARPSLLAMPPDRGGVPWVVDCGAVHGQGSGCCWSGEWADCYLRAAARRAQWDAEQEAQRKAFDVRLRTLMPESASVPEISEELQAADPDAWRALLLPGREEESYDSSGHNLTVLLMHHPMLKGTIRFNEVTKSIDVSPGSPFSHESIGSLKTAITDWVRLNYGMSLRTSEVAERIARVAHMNRYDPLAEYLQALEWDGVPRIDTWLEVYAGAKTVDDGGQDFAPYVRRVSSMWLIGAVARALSPGAKLDTVLILEGLQGVGKSTLFEILGGAWFSGSPVHVDQKDGQLAASRHWIIELAELATLNKSKIEAQKSFLATSHDHFRPPYGSAIESFPRRCAFAGTTNADQYLQDETGNRRFWPVKCAADEIDAAGLRAARDQLLAEAVARFRVASRPELRRPAGHPQGSDGEVWWFSRADQVGADEQTNARMGETTTETYGTLIRQWWNGGTMTPERRMAGVSTGEVVQAALGVPANQITQGAKIAVGRALKVLKFSLVPGNSKPRRYTYGAKGALLPPPSAE